MIIGKECELKKSNPNLKTTLQKFSVLSERVGKHGWLDILSKKGTLDTSWNLHTFLLFARNASATAFAGAHDFNFVSDKNNPVRFCEKQIVNLQSALLLIGSL